MATQTGGGTTTSFTNTPQAKDDIFTTSPAGLITENTTGVIYLDVMANDLGGNAKMLLSIDNGVNNTGAMSGYIAGDLLTRDTAQVEATSTDTSRNGAKIWITSDGKVGYDASTLSSDFKDSSIPSSPDKFISNSFIYAIRLASGTLSWATATIQFAGANDASVVDAHGGSLSYTENQAAK